MNTKELIQGLSFGLSGTGGNVIALGLDVVFVSHVVESLRSFGERFEQRLFTPAEIAYARSGPGQQADRLAARFAAKEAVIKALALAGTGVDWRDIEVVRSGDGNCAIALHGAVAAALAPLGAGRVLVSLSHDGDYAAALVAVLSDTHRGGCEQKFTAMDTLQQEVAIRRVLRDHGRLGVDAEQLSPDSDLYQSGMTSHASVNVMLALEGAFDVEFPDHMLNRNVFRTIASIERALGELGAA